MSERERHRKRGRVRERGREWEVGEDGGAHLVSFCPPPQLLEVQHLMRVQGSCNNQLRPFPADKTYCTTA